MPADGSVLLEPSEVRRLSQVSDARAVVGIAGDWLLIAMIWFTAARLNNLLVDVIAVVLIGRTQLALAIIMHDGAHRRLFKSHALNERIGQFACAAPLFFAMDSYKRLHLKHHLDPLVADDPDLSLIGGYPISRSSFFRKITRDLTGISYFKFIGYFIYRSRNHAKPPGKANSAQGGPAGNHASGRPSALWILSSILTAQVAIFGALWLAGHPWFYFFFWMLPFMTLLQLLLRIRGIAEHAGYQPNENQALNARTVVNPWQTFFFAPHGVHYHIEHHLYPSIPYYRLPEAHRILKERGALPGKNCYTSYGKVLSELVRAGA